MINNSSFRSLHKLLGNLGRFFETAGEKGMSPELQAEAAVHVKSVHALQMMLAHFFVDEGRQEGLVRSPQAEIFRTPIDKTNYFADRPTFIIGNRRSGTTLLAYLLNASRNICAMPENFLAGTVASSDAMIRVGHRMMTSMREPIPGYLIELGKFVDGFYSRYSARQGKSRWVSKELLIPRRLDLLDAMFDYQSRQIFIVRHGVDVAYSCSARFPGRDGPALNDLTSLDVETYLTEWVENTEATLDFQERNPERCMLVRYEELIADFSRYAQSIFKFLGEPWDDEVLSRMEAQELEGMGDNSILVKGARAVPAKHAWEEWPRGLLSVLGRKANATLIRAGYAPL